VASTITTDPPMTNGDGSGPSTIPSNGPGVGEQ